MKRNDSFTERASDALSGQEHDARPPMPSARPLWLDALAGGPDERPVPEQLLAIVRNVEAFFLQSLRARTVGKAANSDLNALSSQDLGETPPLRAPDTLVDFFEQLHAQGRIGAPQPESTATAFLGAVYGPYQICYGLGELTPARSENYAELIVQIFWTGIRPE